MAYRRERDGRAQYEHFHPERMGPYDRRLGFGRPEDIPRGFDYSIQRYSNGGPRGYHGDDSRSYYTDGAHRNLPRRDDPHSYYREPRDELHLARQLDLREHRDSVRRKPLFPPQRERSPFRKEVPHSPHSRSGSSLSSRSYSPDRSKCFTYQTQQRKNKDRPSSYSVNGSRDGSPLSSASTSKVSVDKAGRAVDPSSPDVLAEKVDKPLESSDSTEARVDCEEPCLLEAEHEEAVLNKDDPAVMNSNYAERRSEAIAAKAREIEKVYRRDCETFGMVVKMLVAKEPSLESVLQNPLRENLSEIRERCLEDLKHFIYELDEAVLRS